MRPEVATAAFVRDCRLHVQICSSCKLHIRLSSLSSDKIFLVATSLIITFALSRRRADIFIFHVFFQRCRLCAFRVQEVLEETRGTERDYHGNRGNRAEVRQRSTDHTRRVPPADVQSGSSHVRTIIGDLPECRGAAGT